MEFGRLKSQFEKLGSFNRIMVFITGGLLLSNLLLVGLFYWVEVHKEVIVVPAVVKAPFAVSDSSVDASYLEQMALFLVYLRFNVTPDNVDKQEGIVEQYLSPEVAAPISAILASESQAVTTNKISSQFYMTDVKVDSAHLEVQVSGTLDKDVGNMDLQPENKTYLLKFSYHYGRLQLLDFSELTKNTGSDQ